MITVKISYVSFDITLHDCLINLWSGGIGSYGQFPFLVPDPIPIPVPDPFTDYLLLQTGQWLDGEILLDVR